jgi:hypothetical protein
MKAITKKKFRFLPNINRNIPIMIFGHMSCAGRYNLGLDGANLVGIGSKWLQRHGLKTIREFLLIYVLKNFYLENNRIFRFWQIWVFANFEA